MHSNPSTTVHHSTLHQGKVAHCLFLTDQICQFSNAFCRWSTTMLRTMQMIRLFVISVYQRREKAINLALLCVEKKRPWRGRSKATCHQIDLVGMMICQLVYDISQLQASHQGDAKPDFHIHTYYGENKGIRDAGSTADIRMLWPWSALVCLGLL